MYLFRLSQFRSRSWLGKGRPRMSRRLVRESVPCSSRFSILHNSFWRGFPTHLLFTHVNGVRAHFNGLKQRHAAKGMLLLSNPTLLVRDGARRREGMDLRLPCMAVRPPRLQGS